ncbi:hypothetical protein SAMN04515667_0778 [Formosa sp. Hel1_31_208]|uniref:hypothetical protein n=1 Tax=Formosa sp. Hel1_31_208 TaxID=1798225 RepID=UPI00087CE6AE|nr:hypothetical protein [Formosa sp. Hel1_31_208]SDR82935.1 hypothetical protein SAMN04515667_0778 [Formosa sp. Hel1_31_208]
MDFIEKHKAFILTTLITGTIVLAMFSFHIKQKTVSVTESYYQLEPPTTEELEDQELQKRIEELANLNPKSNQAFNEDEEFKQMMRNFKTVNSNDFQEVAEDTEKPTEESSENPEELLTSNTEISSSKTYALNEKERKTFNKANDILAMHSTKKDDKTSEGNKSSSVSFSLSNRTKVSLPPPVYLCEETGKIVVNIKVNAVGLVTETYINSSSSTDNQCLIDHAIEYAKNARFSSADRKQQIGSITYYFQGKH